MPSAASPIVLGNPLARQICFLLAEQPMDLATLCKRSQRCERQVRRALDELRRLGIQLHTERQRGRGSPKVYSLPPDHAPLQLLLNRLDALALRFLLVRGRPRADEPYHAEVAQLEAKLKAVLDLPGRALYPKLERILPESRPAPPGGVVEEEGNEGSEPGEPTGVQAITDDLLAAACYHHVCDIRYRTSAGEERIHPIHPLIVFQRKGRWYVDAWEPGAGEVHRYALPRFLEVRRRLGEHFEPPADYDATASMAGPMGAFHDGPWHVRVRFDAKVAAQVREQQVHPSQRVTELPDGGLEVSLVAEGRSEICAWVMYYGELAELLEPVELRAEVARRLREAAGRYGASELSG